ncbi:MAG: hypothetical protein GY842_20520 [bacterium]|nr:hypothetical protein [bacterium]
METAAITSGADSASAAKPSGFAGLDGDDFFELLVAQLSNQDPLEPTSNQELLNQISSIRDIQASTSLAQTLETLAGVQGFGSAASLLGQYVSGTGRSSDGTSTSVSGMVAGLRVDPDGTMVLLLDTGEELPASAVEHVTSAVRFAEALRGRLVSGVDRRDPQEPSPVEGIVTGMSTDSVGQVLLELDSGAELRLVDVVSAVAADSEV